ncbi:hypothetical protein A2375_01245 [Candidatus Woesebacteria bacterium RIFOXYB1_FULL_31_120]|nr:MAG: hypothetical protein A2375_01245 [Candidatus Woesebacteria bacterium RIFOXYB1_FULL_31_120]
MNFLINNIYLHFSDGAKFAIIAKKLALGNGFSTDFSFWGEGFFSTSGIPVFIPYLMSLFMNIFGTNDFSVLAFSFTFYLLLSLVVFLLGRKIFNPFVGLLSSLVVLLNLNFIGYATSGASEPFFAFEIVLATYLLVLRKRWTTFLFFLVMGLMYFSRPQAFIFIAGLIFLWLILKFSFKKALVYFFGLGVIGLLFDKLVLYPLSFKFPVTPIFMRGMQSILTYSSFNAVSDGLRGGTVSSLTIIDVFKKVFYNLYNFYKALPEIANSYLWGLFFVGLFTWGKDKLQNNFKISAIFMTLVTFLITALTIPFYRYIHPVIPFVYIIAIATLFEIVSKLANKKHVKLISLILVFIFCIGQTLGVIFLDSRFKVKTINKNKPPVYAVLSYKLKEITDPSDIILTNLDTWGSWYGERKTVWFPLEPSMIIPVMDKIDAIYLTSYLIDDENYYMGINWREMFNNPKTQTVLKNFKFVGEYTFKAEDNYQRQDAKAVLFIKD